MFYLAFPTDSIFFIGMTETTVGEGVGGIIPNSTDVTNGCIVVNFSDSGDVDTHNGKQYRYIPSDFCFVSDGTVKSFSAFPLDTFFVYNQNYPSYISYPVYNSYNSSIAGK